MKRIILAEDDESIQDIVRLVLKDNSYQLIVYSDGNQLLDNSLELPDLFILDKQLPGVDGLEICRHLKKQPRTKHIPVIMLSASPTIKITAPDAGAEDAIEKPFKIRDLREIISKYIGI